MTAHGTINVTVDIETWGGPNKPSLDDIQVPANYKNPDTIQAYRENKLESAWKDQALDSIKGEIICIGYQIDGGVAVSFTGTEVEIMEAFENVLIKYGVTNHTQVYFIGHNLTTFDLPWILRRAWKYKLQTIIGAIPINPYDEHIVDTINLFAGPGVRDQRNKNKLDDIAKFLGLEGKTEGFDGSMVHDAFIRGEIKKIAKYCENDVGVTTAISKIVKPEIW